MKCVISLGAGVQSTTMLMMAAHGLITPMPDCAIFADTQAEPEEVYTHLRWLQSLALPIPIVVATKGSLAIDSMDVRRSGRSGKLYHKANVPAYTLSRNGKKGMLPRQCTRDYKILVVQRALRKFIGIRQFKKTGTPQIEMWIGISLDEVERVTPSRVPWAINRHPLADMRMSRQDCLNWMEKYGYPRPPRSACVFCPYHSDAEWLRLKNDQPEEFAKAVLWERAFMQQASLSEVAYSMPFLHPARVPLDRVQFSPGSNERQFSQECVGMCGV